MTQPLDSKLLQTTPASTNPPTVNPSSFLFRSFSGVDRGALSADRVKPLSWLWHGYLAAGNVTVLTSQWKSGKTSLVSVLVARMTEGGELAGLGVKPGRAMIVSEESDLNWMERHRKLHFGDNVRFLCRPFPGKPTMKEWAVFVDAMVLVRQREGLDLVVIDPLATFLPGRNENTAGSMVEVLMTLQRLTSLGISVWILHHPRKGETRAGQASRGSGALGAYADILMEMNWYSDPTGPDQRRVITAYSRHEETPRRLVIERTADGADYISHGDLIEEGFAPNWEILQKILTRAPGPLTRRQIREQWPRFTKKPDEVTLWRWLERVVGDGTVTQTGSGKRNDPFRFELGKLAEA